MSNEPICTARTYDHMGSPVELSFEPAEEWIKIRIADLELWVNYEEWVGVVHAGNQAMSEVFSGLLRVASTQPS